MVVCEQTHLDHLVKWHTAFKDFADMLDCHKSYRPSINCIRNKVEGERADLETIANAFDAEMEKRGDERRAYRY